MRGLGFTRTLDGHLGGDDGCAAIAWCDVAIFSGTALLRAPPDGQVTFRYRDGTSGKTTLRTVGAGHFLWMNYRQPTCPRAWRQCSFNKPPFAPSRPCNEGRRGNNRRLAQAMCATWPSASAKLVRDIFCVADQLGNLGSSNEKGSIAASRNLSLFV